MSLLYLESNTPNVSPVGPCLQPVEVPLDGSITLWYFNHSSHDDSSNQFKLMDTIE